MDFGSQPICPTQDWSMYSGLRIIHHICRIVAWARCNVWASLDSWLTKESYDFMTPGNRVEIRMWKWGWSKVTVVVQRALRQVLGLNKVMVGLNTDHWTKPWKWNGIGFSVPWRTVSSNNVVLNTLHDLNGGDWILRDIESRCFGGEGKMFRIKKYYRTAGSRRWEGTREQLIMNSWMG